MHPCGFNLRHIPHTDVPGQCGGGVWDLRTDGNEISNNATLEASTSPAGDILFSTRNFNNGDSYTIIVEVR